MVFRDLALVELVLLFHMDDSASKAVPLSQTTRLKNNVITTYLRNLAFINIEKKNVILFLFNLFLKTHNNSLHILC